MGNRVKNDRGVMLVEASVYMPLMVIMLLGIVMIFMFKLNKIYGQSVLSQRDMEMQMKTSRSEVVMMSDELGVGDMSKITEYELLGSTGTSSKIYSWKDEQTAYPIQQTDYEIKHGQAMFKMLSQSTLHGYLVRENPDLVSTAAGDVALFRTGTSLGSVVKGKTGYGFDEYIGLQYGY